MPLEGWFSLEAVIGGVMKPEELDKIKETIWELSEKQSLDRSEIQNLMKIMRRLLNSYKGAIKKLYRQRLRKRDQ